MSKLSKPKPGYAAGNILNMLVHLGADLTGYDFSGLSVWGAYVPNVDIHDICLARSNLRNFVFKQTFGMIFAVAFSPNTEFLAMGSTNGTLHVWRLMTLEYVATYMGHTDSVRSIVFSPDSQTLISGSDDQTIREWDVGTAVCVQTLSGHTGWIHSVQLSSDGNTLVSGSRDHSIRLWDMRTGQCSSVLHGHTGTVWTVTFSPDGRLLASGSSDQTIRIWDLADKTVHRTFYGVNSSIIALAFRPDGKMLAVGSNDSLQVWDVESEYVTERLIEAVCDEISRGSIQLLNSHALMKAQAKEYVRNSQVRLILDEVVTRLAQRLGNRAAVVARLTDLLAQLRAAVP